MIDLNKLDITGDFIFNSLDVLNYLGLFLIGFLFYKNVIKKVVKLWKKRKTFKQGPMNLENLF